MINITITENGFVFSGDYDGHPLHFNEWSETDDCIYYFPLATLVDNGNASFNNNECIVPFESIYLLEENDRIILGIPQSNNKSMRLRGEGMLNTADFSYSIEFLSHVPDGKLLPYKRIKNVVSINDTNYILSESQWQLFEKIDKFNSLPSEQKTTDYNLRQFAEIKQLAIQSGCHLDSYLANENVFTPEQIHLELGRDDKGFSVLPTINIENGKKFTTAFDKGRNVLPIYPIQDDKGERTRVVLSQTQKECLGQLKKTKCRFNSRSEIQELIEHPTEYFDPEQFDLSDFYSDRVIEIGIYKPKFYPFVSPYKSCWIAGATVETPSKGTTRITIKSEEELDELRSAINTAVDEDKDIVDFRDSDIDIEDARYLADIAEKQLASPKKPVKDMSDKHVLIIEENAEELRYEPDRKDIEKESHYILYPNPRLSSSYNLKEHQKEGVAWLQHMYKSNALGCLMADDMGLGKTLQILYFIDWHSQNFTGHKPYLIVAPISLLENWESEYSRFFPSSNLTVTRLTTQNVPRQFNRKVIDEIQQMDIILTNYDSLRIAQLNFCAVEYDIVVLDEAQNIKTPGTMKTNAAKALKSQFKIAMTGTPVENTLVDLWSIMDFCVPGLLGNAKTFASIYQSPLKNEDTDVIALGEQLHNQLGMYLIRRMKTDVAKDLPQKHEIKKIEEMPALQEEYYQKVVNDYQEGIIPDMLQTIQGMRSVSEHPYLYDGTLSEHNVDELVDVAARVQATIKILDDIKAKQEKVIVFAERKDSQRMLQRLFHQRYGVISKIINGDTPTISVNFNGRESRQTAIDHFQSQIGFGIIIMSPIAAGMGLNVTKANHVIHFSRHWNPAKENQATDRAYRIGQTKDVYVYYPIAVSDKFKSFDLTLDELLNRKTTLASSTIFPTERIEVKQEELSRMLFN